MAKCPLKFRLYQFEGSQECDPECMWLVDVYPEILDGNDRLRVCAMTLVGKNASRAPVNRATVNAGDEEA